MPLALGISLHVKRIMCVSELESGVSTTPSQSVPVLAATTVHFIVDAGVTDGRRITTQCNGGGQKAINRNNAGLNIAAMDDTRRDTSHDRTDRSQALKSICVSRVWVCCRALVETCGNKNSFLPLRRFRTI